MKKIYESPKTIVVRLAVQNVIAVSFSGTMGSEETSGDEALSSGYRNSLWGDNE